MGMYRFPRRVSEVFAENPELKYVPEFSGLVAKKMLAVMLIADYYSPFAHIGRTKGDRALREQTARYVGYVTPATEAISREGLKIIDGEDEEVEKAIRIYRINQGVDHLELLDKVESAIRKFVLSVETEEPKEEEEGVVFKKEKKDKKPPTNEKSIELLFNMVSRQVLSKLMQERNNILTLAVEQKKTMEMLFNSPDASKNSELGRALNETDEEQYDWNPDEDN